jgi:hypothetical protein
MPLTANREVGRLVDGPEEAIRTYAVAAGTRIYKGSLVGLNSAGYLRPMAAAATTARFIGVLEWTTRPALRVVCRVFTRAISSST